MSKINELRDRLAAKQAELAQVFEEAGPNLDMDAVKTLDGSSADKVDWIKQRNAELDSIGREIADLDAVAKAAEATAEAGRRLSETRKSMVHPGADVRPEQKSIGELVADLQLHQRKNTPFELDVDVKTVMSTGAGWEPETSRTGRVVDIATQPIEILDLIPTTTTGQAAVVYMEETTFTNAAAEVAESVEGTPGTYPEAALALTERTSPVRKIAVWLPVSDEQLEDEPMAQGYVNNRLPFMLRQRLQTQVITGNGTPPNLEGIQVRSGIQTQAKGADPTPDAIHKAITKVRVTGRAEPNAVGLHPNDWQEIRLLRTADGIYIWGSPSEAGPARIWGLPVVASTVFTENTGLVGDFANYSELAIRRGIEVQVTNSHDTFFIEGKQAIRADMRAALQVYRPAAFCTVTGI